MNKIEHNILHQYVSSGDWYSYKDNINELNRSLYVGLRDQSSLFRKLDDMCLSNALLDRILSGIGWSLLMFLIVSAAEAVFESQYVVMTIVSVSPMAIIQILLLFIFLHQNLKFSKTKSLFLMVPYALSICMRHLYYMLIILRKNSSHIFSSFYNEVPIFTKIYALAGFYVYLVFLNFKDLKFNSQYGEALFLLMLAIIYSFLVIRMMQEEKNFTYQVWFEGKIYTTPFFIANLFLFLMWLEAFVESKSKDKAMVTCVLVSMLIYSLQIIFGGSPLARNDIKRREFNIPTV